jgi:hypothetical protein
MRISLECISKTTSAKNFKKKSFSKKNELNKTILDHYVKKACHECPKAFFREKD